MTFLPAFCPHFACPAHGGKAFNFQRRGAFRRRTDGRTVARFQCQTCSRFFCEQSFRLDYRLRRPELLSRFYLDRISKVTHRQSARNLRCSRTTEERHFRRLTRHCGVFHDIHLAEVAARGGLGEVFLLDELETYEHHRLKKPVTVPILIERESGFVLDARTGAMAARGKRKTARKSAKLAAIEAAPKPGDRPQPEPEPERKSESRRVVREAFERLREFAPKNQRLRVLTDRKPSYAQILEELFGARVRHERTISTRRRDKSNPLWPINHTLARVRDNVSRLVRETWAAAKKRECLAGHLAIFICYRNYVRDRTNVEPGFTPAMALGVRGARLDVEELLRWRVFFG